MVDNPLHIDYCLHTFRLSLQSATIGSTVDPIEHGGTPYGLAIAPATAGLMSAGDLVVCNFNYGATNTQVDGSVNKPFSADWFNAPWGEAFGGHWRYRSRQQWQSFLLVRCSDLGSAVANPFAT
jgi:hypothetical protein